LTALFAANVDLAHAIDIAPAMRGKCLRHACGRPRARATGHHSRMGRGALAAAAFGAALAIAMPASASEPANVPWETYLPALPASIAIQPRGVPNCRKATLRCIDVEIRRLRGQQKHFGCDHRAVFATTYLELTRQLRDTLLARPRFFNDSKYLYVEDALFANVYINTLTAYARGKPVPPAWQIAFDTARSSASMPRRTCCSVSTRTCRTTCRSCSPRSASARNPAPAANRTTTR
jgi:hypothetical protein